jgi:hypothetical protein
MTNLDMIKHVLRCDDLQAQKVYRCLILGGYDFDNVLMVNFETAVKMIDKNLKERLNGQDEGVAQGR